MKEMDLRKGDVVQLAPTAANQAFAYCMMIIDEPKPWGAQGYVQGLGENREKIGGQYYYRAKWEEMEYVGHATWEIGRFA